MDSPEIRYQSLFLEHQIQETLIGSQIGVVNNAVKPRRWEE